MSCKRGHCFAAIAVLLLGSACRRAPERPSVEKIAVLRFENLGADASSDWVGRAFSEIISSELTGIPGLYAIPAARLHALGEGLGARPASLPGISAERPDAVVAGATKIVYGQYEIRGGTLDAQVTVEDEIDGSMTVLHSVAAPAADVVTAASSLAREISPRASAYGTQNASVIETYAEAFEHLDAPGTPENLQKAIVADPNFAPLYRQLAQWRARQGDLDGALDVLHQALARGSAIPAEERARIQLEEAGLRNDPDGRLQALAAVAKADPYDVQTWQDLGSAAMTAHRYQEAVEAFRKVTALQPDNADAWNLLGYSSAFAGDADGASRAIAQYGKVAPGAPNPLDSLGDVQLMNGHLPEAEKTYLENARKYPQFYAGLDLLKAAMARLMTGDVAGADGLAQQYFTARMAAKDAAVDYRRAQWAWISGRRKAACAQMEQVAGAAAASNGGRNLASHAYMELAMWSLMLGNREPAAAMAQKAAALATPVSAMQATLARFLTQAPASADEWKARAALLVRQRPDAPIGKTALADALLFAKEFAAAQPILQSMYDSGNNTADEGLPVLLAWADVETGRIDQAAALVDVLPALADSGLSWSTALYFPRVFYLRGAIAEKQGKADEARENFRIFHQLSGPDPLLWGEEQEGR